jgi:hypothetical protein
MSDLCALLEESPDGDALRCALFCVMQMSRFDESREAVVEKALPSYRAACRVPYVVVNQGARRLAVLAFAELAGVDDLHEDLLRAGMLNPAIRFASSGTDEVSLLGLHIISDLCETVVFSKTDTGSGSGGGGGGFGLGGLTSLAGGAMKGLGALGKGLGGAMGLGDGGRPDFFLDDAATVDRLLRLLTSRGQESSEDVTLAAMKTIGKLAERPANHPKMLAHGCLGLLVTVSDNLASPEVAQTAAVAIARLAENSKNASQVLKERGVSCLIRLAQTSSDALQEASASALRALAPTIKRNSALVEGLYEAVLELTRSEIKATADNAKQALDTLFGTPKASGLMGGLMKLFG